MNLLASKGFWLPYGIYSSPFKVTRKRLHKLKVSYDSLRGCADLQLKSNLLNKQLTIKAILREEHAIRCTFTGSNHHDRILLIIQI